jgi:hypothetical protein
LLKFIEEHEAREELNKKKKAEGYTEIWDAEKEKVYQRLMRATEDTLQVTTHQRTSDDAIPKEQSEPRSPDPVGGA